MKLTHDAYRVGWVCPLEVEQVAAMEMLDEEHDRLPQPDGDTNIYNLGSIHQHNVVIAGLPRPGNCPAATVVTHMVRTFPRIKYILLVGIGGGVPVESDQGPIRLGHVIVSKPTDVHSGAIQYDHGKAKIGEFDRTGSLAPPPTALLHATREVMVQQQRMMDDPVWKNTQRIRTGQRRLRRFRYPGKTNDHLYQSDYDHRKAGVSCKEAACDAEQRIDRATDKEEESFIVVHRGTIASGELVLKNAILRDRLAREHGILCFEMEAAGALADFAGLVIRGVSDYCDSHKNDDWHGFAAAAAAAFARQLFYHMSVDERPNPKPNHVYHIPYRRNRNFSGRIIQLDQLHRMLFEEQREQVVVVGLGGMGKTQIALELAYRVKAMSLDRAKHQRSVFWMPAQSLAAFRRAAMEVVQRLKLPVNEGDDAAELLRRYLSSETADRWLLVLDNLDDVVVLRGKTEDVGGLFEFLPRSQTGKILVTTRLSAIAEDLVGSEVVELEEMTPEEAYTLLQTLLNKDVGVKDRPIAMDLLKRLAHMPLTIGQAAAYMNQKRLPISAYLRLWDSVDKGMVTLMSKQLRDETHYSKAQGAVATTWIVSFEAIRREDAGAAEVLSFIQWVDFKAIPVSMLPSLGSEMDMIDSIGTICGYGFISWRDDGETLDMHRLVHLALGLWTKQTQNRLMTKKEAGKHLSAIFPSADWENRFIWRQYLPHVLPFVTEANLAEDNGLAILGYHAGLCLAVDGRTRERVEILNRVVAIQGEALSGDDIDLLNTQYELAKAYKDNGQVQETVKMLEKLVAIEAKILAEDHPDRLATQNALAGAYSDNGQVQEAVNMLEEVVAVEAKILAEDHSDRLASQHELGVAYEANGQVIEAVEILEEVVAIRKRLLTEDHPDQLASQSQLAAAYLANRQVEEAVMILEEVVAIRKKILAEDHPSRLVSQHELARAYLSRGQVRKGVKMLEEVVAIRAKTIAEDHPDRLGSQHMLAIAYKDNGQVKEALEILKKVVSVRKKTLAEHHPSRLNSEFALASLRRAASHLDSPKCEKPGGHHEYGQIKDQEQAPDYGASFKPI